MADEEEGKDEKKGGGLNVPGLVITAVLAGAASYGGSLLSIPPAEDPQEQDEKSLPGESVALEPFVITLSGDEKGGKDRAAKIVVALELNKETTGESFKIFMPRIRDALLGYLRSQSAVELADFNRHKSMGQEMLKAVHGVGGDSVVAVLIQDIVVQ